MVVETALDNGSASSIEKLFTSHGGKAIDYDRQVIGGTASVYVTFDGNAVGRAQANGIIAAMKANGTYSKSPSSPSCGAARPTRTRSGSRAATTTSSIRSSRAGALTKGPQQFVPDWLATNAAPIFSQMLVKTNNKIDAAIAANDNIAGAVIAQEKAKHLKPIPLSGQDATPQGVQNILAGWQSGTVYKYVPDEANAAAAAAVALLKGQTPKTTTTRKNGTQERADAGASGGLDHEGELHAALHGHVPEEERRLHRHVQAVLQVGRRPSHGGGAPTGAPPLVFLVGTRLL